MEGDAMALTVAFQRAEHFLRQRIGEGASLAGGGHDVIHGGHRPLWATHRQPLVLEGGKSLRTGDLVNEVQTDQQLGGPTGEICDTVQIPDLVVKRAAAHSGQVISRSPYAPASAALHRGLKTQAQLIQSISGTEPAHPLTTTAVAVAPRLRKTAIGASNGQMH